MWIFVGAESSQAKTMPSLQEPEVAREASQMRKTPDFSAGDQFGSLTVLSGPYAGRDAKKSRPFYEVVCACGAVKMLRKDSLKVALSCGCQNAKVDLIGQVFSRLTVISAAPSASKRTYWNCVCSCGKKSVVRADCLINGTTQSCGCLVTDNHSVKHGHGSVRKGRTRTYNAWVGLKQRGLNPKNRDARKYSARGITVDPRWFQFENFLEDMGECPEGMSIDRYPDNDGNYEKANCRWATPKQQANNTRRTIKVFFKGNVVTISDLVEISGKKHNKLYQLIKRGLSAEEAIAA